MTYAPTPLLQARAYLLSELDMHPGATVDADLDPAEVGIVGDTAHNGGYHCGWDRRRLVDGVLRDYSWTESPRDWGHKSNAARGLDVGWFSAVLGGRTVTLYDFNRWQERQLLAGAPDTLDIRESIYTLDGRTVKRFDRLGKRSGGDLSHLRHTHNSYFADAEHRDKTGLFRRFIAETKGTSMGISPDGRAIVDELAAGARHPQGFIDPGSGEWAAKYNLRVVAQKLDAALTRLAAIEARPPVAFTDAQVADLGDRLAAVLDARVDAIVDRVVRRILGSLDETPPT